MKIRPSAGGAFTGVTAVVVACMLVPNSAAEPCEPSWTALPDRFFNHLIHQTVVADIGDGEHLYVMGDFFDNESMNRIVRWDGESWSSLGNGASGSVRAAAVFDDGTGPALYVGGVFPSMDDVPGTGRIARWDGESWSSVGGGMNSSIFTLAVYDDGNGPALYAGGVFTMAGTTPANRVAKWDGEQWHSLDEGVNSSLFTLFPYDNGDGMLLYAGGIFTQAGGAPAARLAAWDGTSWAEVGGGVGTVITHSVLAMAGFDDGTGEALHVAGNFDDAGGTPASNIAKWDGETWTAVGGGTNSNINGLAVFDDGAGSALYAGGLFTSASGVPGTSFLARWNGQSWSSVGGGADNWVISFSVYDDGGGSALYAGGHFTTIGGVEAERIARWGCPPIDGPLGDLNGDGIVDGADLLILLSHWGPCPPTKDCPADLNEDGDVDGADLLILLSNWG
jgi:hypothetical protein